jgi:TetR/AcrR family transcriptional regulator, transcriptional repressor of bet genes
MRVGADGVDITAAARHLVGVLEGLCWPVLFGTYTEQEALGVLDAELDRIFG